VPGAVVEMANLLLASLYAHAVVDFVAFLARIEVLSDRLEVFSILELDKFTVNTTKILVL
jgi:hypothetical protein